MYRPRILVIMETRCDPNKLEKTFQLLGSDGWCYTNIRGYAGGLVVVSTEGDVSISLTKLNISTWGVWFQLVLIVCFFNMHVKIAWGMTWGLLQLLCKVWLVTEDFNDIATASRKKG